MPHTRLNEVTRKTYLDTLADAHHPHGFTFVGAIGWRRDADGFALVLAIGAKRDGHTPC